MQIIIVNIFDKKEIEVNCFIKTLILAASRILLN